MTKTVSSPLTVTLNSITMRRLLLVMHLFIAWPTFVSASRDTYPWVHRVKGICVIVNNHEFKLNTNHPNRDGTYLDAVNMKRTFGRMGFTVSQYNDVTKSDMLGILKRMSHVDHRHYDAFVLIILTHGDDGGVLWMTDDMIDVSTVLSYFRPTNCPSLVRKPKIFIISACRGGDYDNGVTVNQTGRRKRTDIGPPTLPTLPVEADFLIAYSVPEGYFSWRSGHRGTWFIQALTDVFDEKGHDIDLVTILTRTAYDVATDFSARTSDVTMRGKKQVPQIVSTLTRTLFFTRVSTGLN